MMPHVDEGTLHALLDGALRAESPERAAEVEAHLAACEDCRARLEAAGELRGEASGILDAAIAGDVAVSPDFADVRRRAESRPTGDDPSTAASAPPPGGPPGRVRRQARWTRGVAWAASLVLALGTGYLIRDLGPTADAPPSRALGSEALESAPAAGSGPEADEAAERELNASDDGAARADRMAAPPLDPAPAEPRAEAATEPGGEPGTEPTPTERARTERPAEQAAAPEPRAEADAAGKTAEVGEPETPAENVGSAREPEPVMEELAEMRAAGFEATATRWTAITVDEAREILDGPLYVLPRAELVDLYKGADTTQHEVLSLQELQTGVPVQVLQWRGGDEEDAEAAADRTELSGAADRTAPARDDALPLAALPDANVVRVVRDEFVLELTGSLPPALLLVLGETADPAS